MTQDWIEKWTQDMENWSLQLTEISSVNVETAQEDWWENERRVFYGRVHAFTSKLTFILGIYIYSYSFHLWN